MERQLNKKIILCLALSSFVLISGCSVWDGTGFIRITNRTSSDITNVKVGSTFLALRVAPGNYSDYWYMAEITGNLSSENIEVRSTQKDSTFTLKPGFWVDIIASTNGSGSKELYIQATKIGHSLSPADWIK
jgi:hypothetical protein